MNHNHTGQEQLERALEPIETEGESYEGADEPLMPFPTSYRLTREQEDELVGYAIQRKEEIEREMGRDVVDGGNWWGGESGQSTPDPLGIDGPQHTWFGKRILYDKTFKNEMGWRAAVLGGIFAKSNLCVTVARDITRKMIARAVGYFFETSPWFTCKPVGAMDKKLAEQADRYTRWKMEVANFQEVEESAIEQAFIIGEAVVKTEWAQREQLYETTETVLVDEMGGDILGANGDYITENDIWIQDSSPDPMTGEMMLAELMVLKRDGLTPKPDQAIWQEKLITRRIVHYKGPEAQLIHYMDFLCPLTAKSIQQADCVVHVYDMPLMDLADQWRKSSEAADTPQARIESTMKAMKALRLLQSQHGKSTGQNSSVVDSATRDSEESGFSQPNVKLAEFHIRYDIDGRGLRDIVLVVDTQSRTPIFYDYEAKVTADGLRPFTCHRAAKVLGRWYGSGSMELMNPSQEIIDLWFNRKNFAVSNSGRVDLWNSDLTKEGAKNPHLRLNWGQTYTKANKDVKAADILESVYLVDNIGDKLMEMMQFVMQIMSNGSGVANANDGNISGMDSTKLATGIRNIEKSGQELFSVFISALQPGVTQTLQKMVKLLFANLDQMEVYRYFEEGEGEAGAELRQIDPSDIANLDVDVEILLTRHRGEQVLEQSMRAIEVIKTYYMELPYLVQINTQDLFRDVLRSLQIQGADKFITPVQDPMQMGGGAGLPDPTQTAQAITPQSTQSEPNL
jgi:hypothetical protein